MYTEIHLLYAGAHITTRQRGSLVCRTFWVYIARCTYCMQAVMAVSPRNPLSGELFQDDFPAPDPIHGQDAIADTDSPPLTFVGFF